MGRKNRHHASKSRGDPGTIQGAGSNPQETIPGSEKLGHAYANRMLKYIERKGGRYLRDTNGSLFVVIEGSRISLSYDRENHALADLMIKNTGVSTISSAAQAAIQRVQVVAARNAGRTRFERFSAVSNDRQRIYIPVFNSKIIEVTADGVKPVLNGDNPASLWLEHPENDPLRYNATADVRAGLGAFKRLVVENEACREPSMRWFVAVHEGLFPYIRTLIPNRLIVVHRGGTQQGKTSGAQRFTLLHGLGQVKGDLTPAALGNMGDIGLLVMDNKEHANLSQELIDFLLFLSTGAQRARSSSDGELRTYNARPVGVITSIEGVHKPELTARCVEVEYEVSGIKIGRSDIEEEILKCRHEILSAAVVVLQRFLKIRNEKRATPNPLPDFEEHFRALCDLLRAYGEVMGEASAWSEAIIHDWDRCLSHREVGEHELEPLIRDVLTNNIGNEARGLVYAEQYSHAGKPGTLYRTTSGDLLMLLHGLRIPPGTIPRTPNALSRRLNSIPFQTLAVLNESNAPGLMHRTSRSRYVYVFIEDDSMTVDDGSVSGIVIPQPIGVQ